MSKLLIEFLFLVAWFVTLDCQSNANRPKIITQNGDIIIEPAPNKNIVLRPNGPNSAILAGEINLLQKQVSKDGDQYQASIQSNFEKYFTGPNSILSRLERLESHVTPTTPSTRFSPSYLSRRVNRLFTRVTELQRRVDEITTDRCLSNPCQKGGTCLNLANGYHCLCPLNWEGKNCDIDVNECRNFAGTDQGCQNGATCINRPGSYECLCSSGWYGWHCNKREQDCSQGNSEMCGHGTCIPSTSGKGFTCICDQGWETNGTSAACLTDINECDGRYGPRCSVNPKVECVNWPGSFRCGQCPAGYEGDGFTCSDINECLTIPNGGCSPLVTCHNTVGSRICGVCPPGYQGDGLTCTWKGSCNINNGGCHPSAQCIELMSVVQCLCPSGMDGDGIGIHGCYISSYGNVSKNCDNDPCNSHGQCHLLLTGYTCVCHKGYSGAHCDIATSVCSTNPCRNGGSCRAEESTSGFRCECTAQYTGNLCELKVRTCGGYLDSEEGSIIYPLTNTTYSDNSKCAWVIHTIPTKVINVTFSKFNLEPEPECLYDFLQIHDGRTSSSQLIGRFCGNEYPKGGKIVSSHNYLYFWFRSDDTRVGSGFALHWNSIDPVCGGTVNASTHGVITSPGSPGTYPPNRDCYWYLSTLPSQRISLSFFTLDIESHPNCSFDFLAIYNGRRSTDPAIRKYCNSTQPQPVTSTSSDIMIHFHSDSHGTGHGFQISYAPTEGIPGCGGLYTLDRGEIVSPSYNGRYLNDLRCEYKISTSVDSKIRVEFKSFELELSPRCRYDYVKVYDGASTDSKLFGKFCGHTMYPKSPIISSSNNLVIIFRTDRSMNYGGFKIAFETICQKTIFGDSGVITSPGYPFSYPENKNCEYIISTRPGKAIQLAFQDFNIEDSRHYNCRYDFVEIRDGLDRNSTLLGKYCGSGRFPPVTTSTHNYLYLRFQSDLSNPTDRVYQGFYANYTTIDTECGGIFRDATGIINHPAAGETYKNNQKCSWLLLAPPGMSIKLSWNSFELENNNNCNSDYLEIIEIDSNNEKESVGKYCGSSHPPSLTTSTNSLLLKFESDYNQRLPGFSVVYTFLDATRSCGGTYIKSHGFIYSPGWPKRYEPNRLCTWTIQVPVGQQIALNISQFNLEQPYHNKCEMGDYLEIRNGLSQAAALIGKYCGSLAPKRIISMANALYIHFHSDFYITGDGFKIEWTSTATRCGGTLTSSSGSITSPNYPEKYNNNEECFYKIITNQGSRIQLSFAVLDIEVTPQCRDDYVAIFDGVDENSPSLGKHCAMSTQLTNIQTTSNVAYIKFRSDFYISGKGFLLNYDTHCQNNVTGLHGVIESPDYPNNYPLNANCLWTITVPKGNKINVTFTHFDLYIQHSQSWIRRFDMNCVDYFQFKETNQLEFSKKYCGRGRPPLRSTGSNSLQIKFVSGNYFSKTGFRLEWASVGCGGTIQKRYGILKLDKSETSRGEMECQWIIEAPFGKKVTIQFDTLYMSESPNCTVDSIEIFNGQNVDSPQIAKVCHSLDGSHRYQSTSNFMTVRFIKNSDLKDVHFSSTFSTHSYGCGNTIRARTGLIYSPNFPHNYDNNLNCIWTLIVPQYHRIELNFISFDLYSNSDNIREDCSDSIRIYDTKQIKSTNYSQIICPNWHVSQVISKTNIMALQFITNQAGTAKGFKANFTVTCGAIIDGTSDGVIKNDKYLSSTNRSCVWTIKAPRLDQKITLTITHMSIPKTTVNQTNRACPSSFLRVLDGDNKNSPLVNEYCGSYTPRIVSHGSAITLEFGTYGEKIEGQFAAHYSSLDNACGGILTSENGEIASPNYPSPYPPDSDCEWTLKTSPGNKVYINFEGFDLESSEDCYQDYVEVREKDSGGRLLGLYCGNRIPTNTTAAFQLFIKFRSDSTGFGKGFVIKYGFLHGSEITGLESGEVASPLYPYPYGAPGQYSWRIIVPKDTISLTITHLEIHTRGASCTNNLVIYDGYDDEAPILENVCGVLRNDEVTTQTTSNVVFIRLTLDELNTGSLFHIRWKRSDVIENKSEKINCGSKKIQFVSHVNSSIFTSPNYPENYRDDLNCEWVYKAGPGRHLELSFPSFHIEERTKCFADYVSVYSSNTPTNWKPVKTDICLKEDAVGLNSSSAYMKVKFVSDSSMTEKGFQGVINSKCGGTLTDLAGMVRPYWYDWYHGRGLVQCDWKVKVRPGRQISIQFISFNITNEKDCKTFVVLRNGESSESPLLGDGKYCGYEHEDRHNLKTTGNALYISYQTLRSGKFKTFSIWYEENNVECGGTSILTNEHNSEIINSPNYPSIPIPYSECVWVFTGPPGERLRIDFLERFDIDSRNNDCSTEYVEVRDGASDLSPVLGHFCVEKPGTIKTRSNLLYVKYSTQISDPRNGFKANVTIDICGGTIYADEGELSSPGYPHMTPLTYGTVCIWQIIGNSGLTFNLQAQDVNLPDSESPCATKLTIEESIPENNTVTVLKEFCSDRFLDFRNNLVQTLTNNVTIKLYVGKSSSFSQISQLRGFRLTFNSSKPLCSGIITAADGYLTTPSYPRSTTIRYCHWRITAPDEYRRITVELEDFDVQRQRIGIYSVNDPGRAATILSIPSPDYSRTGQTRYESTGNSLVMYVWLDPSSGSSHRFKAKFNSDSPALCGGLLDGPSGNLVSPILDRPYTCKWKYNTESLNTTNTIVIKAQVNSSVQGFSCHAMDPNLNIKYRVGNNNRVGNSIDICGNVENVYRIPSNAFELTATKNKLDSLYFNLQWDTQPCGGYITTMENPVNVINIPSSFNETLDCAWVLSTSIGKRVEISLEGSFQLDCGDEYIKIYPNRAQSSIAIGDYCKDRTQESPLLAAYSTLYVEYHSKPRNNTNIKLNAKLTQSQCGGLIINEGTFSSPNYPKSYQENQECEWEIKTDLGSRVSVQFVGRFAIEGQPGSCTKDAVIIYDWNNDTYTEIARLCGRETPQPYNSTFNKMKVMLRTNDKVNLDGFRARWTRICGGVYIATEQEQFLYSPGYPYSYRPYLDCVYKITSEDRRVIVKFSDFELEGPYPECGNDNLTIKADGDYEYYYNVYCGHEMPEMLNYNSLTLTLHTDSFIYKRGFKLSYWIMTCGGEIKTPTVLSSGPLDMYDSNLNCSWSIQAPQDKIIVLNFIKFDIENSYVCYNDYLAIYDDLTIDEDKRLALLCGNQDNSSGLIIKSTNNTMLLNFVTDSSLHGSGFKIAITFSYSESVGCGGHINLTSSTVIKSPLMGSNTVYENFLDCIWTVSAPTDSIIKMEFTSFHIAPCTDVNQTAIGMNQCDCDYVQIRDGILAHSTVINKYCGHTQPMEVVSSGNTLSIVLHTDGEEVSSGFEATLRVETSVCGQSNYMVSTNPIVIKSPNYQSGLIPRGLHCTYYLTEDSYLNYPTIHLHIKNLNLEDTTKDTNKCDRDRLIISKRQEHHNRTTGKDYVMSGDTLLFFDNSYLFEQSESLAVPTTSVLCGMKKSFDLYITGNAILRLYTAATADSDHSGFEIEVKRGDYCSRNYSEPYGRLKATDVTFDTSEDKEDCFTLITAPENHTVSAYFLSISPTMWTEELYLEIHDGNTTSAKRLKKIDVNYSDMLTAFSTGRYMLIHNHVSGYGFIGYDMVYVSSERLPGCGGKLYSGVGRITSPMYPDIFRQKATCVWELETPSQTRLHLRFTTFDLSGVCDQVYVELVDKKGDVISRYCEEPPADYISPNNYVKIVFVSTRNNGGQGWVAEFVEVL